jgi:hypothetical protein
VVTKDGVEVLRRPDEEDAADPERLTQTALEQISENREFRELSQFLTGVRYLHLVPQVIRDTAGRAISSTTPRRDFIARMYAVPARTRNAWLRRVTEALRTAVPRFESLEVNVDNAGRPHLEAKYTNWRTSGARQDEREFSDGTLRRHRSAVVLVEVGRKGARSCSRSRSCPAPGGRTALPSVLARAQRGNAAQVLLTTHSPDLLADEGLAPDEVLVLTPTDDGTTGALLSADPSAVAMVESGNDRRGSGVAALGARRRRCVDGYRPCCALRPRETRGHRCGGSAGRRRRYAAASSAGYDVDPARRVVERGKTGLDPRIPALNRAASMHRVAAAGCRP